MIDTDPGRTGNSDPLKLGFQPLQRLAVSCAALDEKRDGAVADAGQLLQLTVGQPSPREAVAKVPGGGGNGAHAYHGRAKLFTQSSAHSISRAKNIALLHHARMSEFKRIVEKMAKSAGGVRPLATMSNKAVTEGGIRAWFKRSDPENGSKVGAFAESLGLTRGQLTGEVPISDTWWANFKARCRRNDEMKTRLMARIGDLDMAALTPAQRVAVATLLGDASEEAG